MQSEITERAKTAWNSIADEFNQWDALGLDEQETYVALAAALAEQTQQGVEVKDWYRSDNTYGDVMLYSLREDGWRKGEPVMVNDVTVRIERAPGSETDIEPIVQRIRSALVDVPAVEPVAWLDDGTCRAGSDRTAHRVVTDAQKRDMPAAVASSFTTPLYSSPPLSRDSAEVLRSALQRISELTPAQANAKDARDLHHTVKAIADVALAATRSGSATAQKGCAE